MEIKIFLFCLFFFVLLFFFFILDAYLKCRAAQYKKKKNRFLNFQKYKEKELGDINKVEFNDHKEF